MTRNRWYEVRTQFDNATLSMHQTFIEAEREAFRLAEQEPWGQYRVLVLESLGTFRKGR